MKNGEYMSMLIMGKWIFMKLLSELGGYSLADLDSDMRFGMSAKLSYSCFEVMLMNTDFDNWHDFEKIKDSLKSLLTLITEDSIGGLEIENNSKWYPVEPRPDCLLVNTGELMSFATKGTIKSVRHRVKLPTESQKVRFSAPFFLEPR